MKMDMLQRRYRFSAFKYSLEKGVSFINPRGSTCRKTITKKVSVIEELYQVGIKGYNSWREGGFGKPAKGKYTRE